MQNIKNRLFTVANTLTLCNLACGVLATIKVVAEQDFKAALYLVVLAAIFDFFDGFAARVMNDVSPLGSVLDSLADIVSFGLVPSLVIYELIGLTPILSLGMGEYGRYISFIIVLFSALRLARFSVSSDRRTDEFMGLPVPANALFIVSFGALYSTGLVRLSGEQYALIALAFSMLLLSNIEMISLKFSNFSWRDNSLRYILLIFGVVSLATLQLYAIPATIIFYIVMAYVRSFVRQVKRER